MEGARNATRAHNSQAQSQRSLYHCVGSEPCFLASAAWKKKKNRTPEVRLLRVGGIGKEVPPPSCTPSLRPTASAGPEKAASKDAQPEITAPLRSVFLTTLVGDNKANKNLSLAAPQCTAHTPARDRPCRAISSSVPPSSEALYIHNYGHPGRRDSPAKKEEGRSLN